ncbi:hypothetical protein K438DRAFT_1982067 [Mycena galopus ATCC 62051]|nr:hypothetical protein K438DRAFT_1982067 [Mycena galopus ATCC 62051]
MLKERSEIGTDLLFGAAVIELSALDALLPEWRTAYPDHPVVQPAASSRMRLLAQKYWIPFLHPPQMKNNRSNSGAALSCVTAWLGEITEEMGVEVYPGFAGAQFLLSPSSDALTRRRRKGPHFEPGVAFRARATLLADGAHGLLSKQAVVIYNLRNGKEAPHMDWDQGAHTPLTAAGSTTQPMDGLVSIGLVVGLGSKNPYVEPYREFQRTKHHPPFRALLAGGTRLAYGARALTDGGLQSLPRFDFSSGAMTGMLAAEAAFAALHPAAQFVSTTSPGTFKAEGGENSTAEKSYQTGTNPARPRLHPHKSLNRYRRRKSRRALSLTHYTTVFPSSPAHTDLRAVHMHPAFNTRWRVGRHVAYGVRHDAGGKGVVDVESSCEEQDKSLGLLTLHASSFSPIQYPLSSPR